MELLNHLALGFSVALTPINLLYALIGSLLGTLIGVLPGIGPVATIAMLLSTTYALQPVSALISTAIRWHARARPAPRWRPPPWPPSLPDAWRRSLSPPCPSRFPNWRSSSDLPNIFR